MTDLTNPQVGDTIRVDDLTLTYLEPGSGYWDSPAGMHDTAVHLIDPADTLPDYIAIEMSDVPNNRYGVFTYTLDGVDFIYDHDASSFTFQNGDEETYFGIPSVNYPGFAGHTGYFGWGLQIKVNGVTLFWVEDDQKWTDGNTEYGENYTEAKITTSGGFWALDVYHNAGDPQDPDFEEWTSQYKSNLATTANEHITPTSWARNPSGDSSNSEDPDPWLPINMNQVGWPLMTSPPGGLPSVITFSGYTFTWTPSVTDAVYFGSGFPGWWIFGDPYGAFQDGTNTGPCGYIYLQGPPNPGYVFSAGLQDGSTGIYGGLQGMEYDLPAALARGYVYFEPRAEQNGDTAWQYSTGDPDYTLSDPPTLFTNRIVAGASDDGWPAGTVVVSGAGGSSGGEGAEDINGTYELDGNAMGRPVYTKGIYKIRWASTESMMNRWLLEDDTEYDQFHGLTAEDVQLPWEVTEWAANGGIEPAPIVTFVPAVEDGSDEDSDDAEENMTASKGFKKSEGFTHANGFTAANGFTKANGF